MRRFLLLLLGATLAGTACGGDDRSDGLTRPPLDAGAPSVTTAYAVLTDATWTLQEAIDPPADAPIASHERPPLAWYAEYVQTSANESSTVRLSGHRATFDETVAALATFGFTFDDIALQRWQAVGGSAPDDPASPTIIVLANGPTTLVMLSYELDLAELTTITDTVEGVDQSGWIAAGGVVQ